ncbi:MAG: M1 family metallopeptidase [Flavobacteriales bacterium]|nr:M1 family metallopeptidase [Flavobacteriales bacterium]
MKKLFLLSLTTLLLFGCGNEPQEETPERSDESKQKIAEMKLATDHHTYARPNDAVVTHLDWDASVDFETRVISGTAHYDIKREGDASSIIFDIRELTIDSVMTDDGGKVEFEIGPEEDFLGQPLHIPITENTTRVSISYKSAPNAAALLWVEGEKPFLFTQSQAILARTWIPCQDSPGIRFTYNAKVQVPQGLLALMSAENPTALNDEGVYEFKMEQPIPSYLMALAVGDIAYAEIGERTAVYATPDLIEAAHYEFQEMDDMLVAAEALYGDYAWGRYDLLILPAAFPFGGMENPRLTFATPTIIAGDRSLTALVAHELAHSWSGNLVTNATWDDFWLNEGFTVYFEQRIMETVYGRETSEMLATLSYQGLTMEVEEIMDRNPNDTHLKLHLKDRDPDEGMSAIAYDKGYFFLRLLEETVGRERWDVFLKEYFTSNSFKVMDTERFVDYLSTNLLSEEELQTVDLDSWIYGAGLPSNIPSVESDRIQKVDQANLAWINGEMSTADLPWNDWAYQERYRFLTNLPNELSADRLAELDVTYNITATGNNEVLFAWLEQSLKHDYEPAYDRAEEFLVNVGRRKFLTPLYRVMKETGKMEMALAIYEKARPNYHAVAYNTMDELLYEAETNE